MWAPLVCPGPCFSPAALWRKTLSNDSTIQKPAAPQWNLGFAEPPQRPTDLLRHRFPSKIGGRPVRHDAPATVLQCLPAE